jgi:hypothetical protein
LTPLFSFSRCRRHFADAAATLILPLRASDFADADFHFADIIIDISIFRHFAISMPPLSPLIAVLPAMPLRPPLPLWLFAFDTTIDFDAFHAAAAFA